MLLKSWRILLTLGIVDAIENLMYYDPGNVRCRIMEALKENLTSSLKIIGKTFFDTLIYARKFLFLPACHMEAL